MNIEFVLFLYYKYYILLVFYLLNNNRDVLTYYAELFAGMDYL